MAWCQPDRMLYPNCPSPGALLVRGEGKTCFLLRSQYMKWQKPHYEDQRFGFEITMYVYVM